MSLVNRKFFGLVVLLLAIAALCAPAMMAQTNFGAVRGLAKDTQGAVIPDADVTLTNTGTGIARKDKTNSAGEYLFSSVDPGDYIIQFSLKGFKNYKATVTIDLGITSTVDAVLQVGGSDQTVDVVATSAELIDTASANRGELFTQQNLQDLPNLGRNPFVFEKLDTNVTPTGDPRYVRAEDQSGSSSISVGGAPVGANNYVVDGIPIATSSGGVTFIPSPEAVSDAKVQVNTYDAEIGRAGGGTFNTSLKSGTKTYHGALYGTTRQTEWSANSWHNKNTPLTLNGVTTPQTPRPDVTTYLYAGAFGGPLPFSNKVKYLKDTFFWVTEEGYRQAQPLTGSGQLTGPTANEIAGDFTSDFGGLTGTAPVFKQTSGGVAYNNTILFDPTSPFATCPSTSGYSGSCRTAALVGVGPSTNGIARQNVVPASYQNAIGKWIAANAFPIPTFAPTVYASTGGTEYGVSNSQRADDFKTRSDMYSGKMDHVFTPWWTGNISYVNLATQEPSGDFWGPRAFFSSDGRLVRFNNATAISSVFTVNPTTLVTVGYGFNRYWSVTFPYSDGFNIVNGFGGAGLPTGFANLVQSPTFPSISVGTFSSPGASFSGRSVPSASHNFVVGVVKTVGKQNMKAGYVYRALHVASTPTGGAPSFTFSGLYTNVSGQSGSTGAVTSTGTSQGAVTGTGVGLADLLMGLPSSASLGQDQGSFNEIASYHALYFQDDFRVNDKFTVNLGLRYEYELGEREAKNQLVVGFDKNYTITVPTQACGTSTCGGAVMHGGLEFAGQNGYPIHVANQSHTKFSPRVGVAYEFKKGTVIRAGVGVFYSPVGLTAYTPGYTQSSSYTVNGSGIITSPLAAVGGSTPTALTNPFNGISSSAGGTGIVIPPSQNIFGDLTGLLAGSVSAVDQARRDPLVEQYSVDLQRELPWGFSVKAAYSGAHSKNDPLTINLNQLPDSQFAALAAAAAAGNGVNLNNTKCTNGCTANPYYYPTLTNPATGIAYSTGSLTNSTTITQAQLMLPYPQFSSVSISESVGYSLYNAFSVKVQKRPTKGLTVLFGYTWSSNWDNLAGSQQDNYNLKAEYARATNDFVNRMTLAGTWDIPVGRGRRYFGNMPKLVDYALGGWQLNDGGSIRSTGGPFDVTAGTQTGTLSASGFGGTIRPNMVPGVNPCYTGRPQSRSGQTNFGVGPYFNPAAFAGTPAFQYGNEPRELNCKAPGLSNTDLSINKSFPIGDRVKVQFRCEVLNATNTPEFTVATGLTASTPTGYTSPYYVAPTLSAAANSTGLISQSNFNRLVQLGGRITF